MATNRKVIFANGEIYHIYNRGVERRPVFTNKREHQRAVDLLKYYRFAHLPMRYSQLLSLPSPAQETVWERIRKENNYEVLIIAYCLMPNHFHLVVKQSNDGGVSRYMANFTNSYTKYFNTKYRRVGSLFQGPFKAIHVETDEQLLHLSRYIHLNPLVTFVVKEKDFLSYPWSSLPDYLRGKSSLVEVETVLSHFSSSQKYQRFVLDQVDYAKKLEGIKHLTFED